MRVIAFAVSALMFVLMAPLFVWGQDGTRMTGRVQGTGGVRVSGAKVTLVQQEAEVKQETSTADDGHFAFKAIAPGAYLLQVEAHGFMPYHSKVKVGADPIAALVVDLKVQSLPEEITVRPDTTEDQLAPDGNTDAMKIDENLFNDLPLEVDSLQPFIDTFISPAAQGAEGTSVVVDGVDGGELDMPSSAIRTVRINRNPYSAEFQHPGAARAEITTKHGHRRRHYGSLAFYARNSFFDARNAFANTKPALNRGLVEGSLGGPLPRQNGFFFIAADHLTNDESTVVNALNTAALTGPLNLNVPAPQRRDHVFARTHWSLTQMQTLSLSYTFSDRSSENNGAGALSLPEQGSNAVRYTHRVQLLESAAITPQLGNEMVLVFKDQSSRSGSQPGAPEILVNGAFVGGPSQTFDRSKRRAFNAQNTTTYTRGRHSFLFGATVRNDWSNVFEARDFGGTFEFSSLDEYRNVVENHVGTPDLFRINQGNPSVSYLEQQTSGFAQDTMRVLPDLTVTAGLRYDWQNTLDDRHDLAPRFALAFSPGKRNRTVFRAGVGVFYDNLPRLASEQAMLVGGLHVTELDISHPSYPDPFLGGQVATPPPSIIRISPAAQSPYLIQTSAGIEQETWKGTWVSLEYSFLHGDHMLRTRDVNAPLPSTNVTRPNPNFTNIEEYESSAFLRGQALTLTFRGGWGKHFKGYGQYIFSKYTNDVSTNGPGVFLFPADNYNLQSEIGPADFDRRHRVNFAGTVLLPQGLRMGSILSASSGAPYDVVTGSDPYGDTLSRPPGVNRNTGRGPATVELDLRFTKVLRLGRETNGRRSQSRRSMEVSLDAFNAVNHVNVSSIVGVASSPLFGRADSAGPARTLQMSAKYSF